MEQHPVIYGLEFQSRALAARSAETERIQFLCGTQTLRNENQMHLLDYDEETGILNKMVFPHPAGEIWDIRCSTTDKDVAAVCYGAVEDGRYVRQAELVSLQGGNPEETDTGKLKRLALLPTRANVQQLCWHPTGASAQLVTTDDKACAQQWSLGGGGDAPREMGSVQLDPRGRVSHSAICWNCHHNSSQIFFALDSAVHSWDTRANRASMLLDHTHGPCVRALDVNPNRPYHMVTCGDDCSVQFWDSRKLDKPLLTRRDHSHWVWSVQFNLFHDQLLLTGSSDSQVLLTRVASIASEPLRHLEDDDTTPPQCPGDEVLAVYEEHEDSVYAVSWSVADAWLFASLSYDGRLVINHVPSQEKYAILTS